MIETVARKEKQARDEGISSWADIMDYVTENRKEEPSESLDKAVEVMKTWPVEKLQTTQNALKVLMSKGQSPDGEVVELAESIWVSKIKVLEEKVSSLEKQLQKAEADRKAVLGQWNCRVGKIEEQLGSFLEKRPASEKPPPMAPVKGESRTAQKEKAVAKEVAKVVQKIEPKKQAQRSVRKEVQQAVQETKKKVNLGQAIRNLRRTLKLCQMWESALAGTATEADLEKLSKKKFDVSKKKCPFIYSRTDFNSKALQKSLQFLEGLRKNTPGTEK